MTTTKLPKVVEDAFWGAMNDDVFHNGPMFVSTAGPHTLRMTDGWDASHIVALRAAILAYDREYVEPLVEAAKEALNEPGFAPTSTLAQLAAALTKWQERGRE